MNRFIKSKKIIKWILIIMPIFMVAFLVTDIFYVNQFNSNIYSIKNGNEKDGIQLSIDTREDSTSQWVKRDYDLYGKTVDLNAQTFDGAMRNYSDYQIKDWSFTLQVKEDCFINNAWCGTVEIHQYVGTDEEKVQTLDLRNYDKSKVKLEYLYDGDILIPLKAGDYIVYYPSSVDGEMPMEEKSELEMGFILYYFDKPDLTNYTLNYQLHRSYTDCYLFYIGIGIGILWLIILDTYLVSRISYQVGKREMEVKKAGISAMSDIYSLIYIVDLKKNELIPVVSDKESEKLNSKEKNAQNQLRNLLEWDSTDMYKETVTSFCDLNTIENRIKNRNTIVSEYISKSHGWCELRFFAMERNPNGELEKLIFAIRIIDDEKAELEALNAEIKEKTENIIDIQQKVVVGLANIIENRDSSTGGHVKRTSDEIRIIINEIQRQNIIPLDSSFADDIVRAAPMHDLGKISIDSSILCKPGRLTKEEFEIMKTHASKSGEMVKLLLDGIEEEHFVNIAFNIARHHHERWDGNGYPDKLKGEEIPIEARIMAIADVYDALVSKRCYKEPMSFEQAYDIMMEGMGSQFDPQMKDVFLKCHKELEEYYKKDAE